MEKKPPLISFILDETRSMEKVKPEVIKGFNEYVETLKNDEFSKSALFALTKFNSNKIEVVYDGVPLEQVKPLSDNCYHPASITPLYDVIGDTINVLKNHNDLSTVLFVVQTDGEENASTRFSRQSIYDMIEECKRAGWTFAFLGMDIDAVSISTTLGIPRGNTVSYSSKYSQAAFLKAAQAAATYAATGGEQTNSLFNDQEDDLETECPDTITSDSGFAMHFTKKLHDFLHTVADFKKRIIG